MAFALGADMRGTSGFVTTDPANCYYVTQNGTSTYYPITSPQGASWGWGGNVGNRQADRDNTVDPRLAGINYCAPGDATLFFEIDLPATGSYQIGLALGDASFGNGPMTCTFFDNVTLFSTPVTAGSVSAGQWYDASGVLRTSSADWVSNNALITHTFSSTVFKVGIIGTVSTYATLSHVFIQAAGGGFTPVSRRFDSNVARVGTRQMVT